MACALGQAQVFVSGQGGAAAISNAASAQAQPVAAAANYDSKVGPAASAAVGYLFNDWFGAQVGYHWNRNRVISTTVAGSAFSQRTSEVGQSAVAGEVMLYFRPRNNWVRPYLSAGPGIVRLQNESVLGLRVAVGADLRIARGFAFRYSFSEMISRNPMAQALQPRSNARLMNFQNLFGFVKVF